MSPLAVEWRVNGALAQSATAQYGEYVAFTHNAPSSGAMTVELKIVDSTSFLLTPHSNTRTWSVSTGAHVLNIAKLGSGTVTSTPSGVSCGTVCSQAYVGATNVTLSASPISGSKFVGWLGDCTGSATSCAVNVNGARQTTAVFAPNASVASLDIDGNGRLEASADGLLAVRYFMLGALGMHAKGAVGTFAQRTSAATTTQHIERMLPALDVDGDGSLNTNVDGVLIVRYMLGFRGATLMADVAPGANATRTTSGLIENHLLGLMIPN
jgi:Divergent InlB B-repeat domain